MGGLNRVTAAGAAFIIGVAMAGLAFAAPATAVDGTAGPTATATSPSEPPSGPVSSSSASTPASSSPASSGATTPSASASESTPTAASSPATAASGPATSKPPLSARPQAHAAVTAAGANLDKATAYLTAPANLIDGHYYQAFPGFADYGLTLDGALALAASRTDDAALARIVTFLNSQGKDASGNSINDYTLIGTPYTGAGYLGKVALLAEATGYNPRAFAGHDLIAALDATVCADGTSTAETTCVAKGNYANSGSVFAQSLGIIAQLRADDAANAAEPIAYLAGLQNTDGSWPSLIPSTGGSDVDSTAMAAMALALVPSQAAAVTKALTWLAGQQLADGGFPGAAGDSTNSAGLAIQGLSLDAAGYSTEIAKARAFLATEQNSDGGFNANAGSTQGSDVRASTQVLGGLVGASFGTVYVDLPSAAAGSKGSAYLVSQLVDGTHLTNAYGVDYGLTADLALALASTNDQDAALARVTGYLRAHVADYADPAGTGQYPGPYSGAVGKLALLAEVTGQDPHAFGGFDLLKTLTDSVCTAADSNGFCTAPGDFSQSYSTISQSLSVLALARAGQSAPAAAITRLEELQCADGGFSSDLITTGQTCTSEVDTTGYAAQALALVPSAAAAVNHAHDYLLAAQQADGGFLGAAGENANSTGLAAQALQALGSGATTPVVVSAAPRRPAAAISPLSVPAGTNPVAAARAFLVSQQQSNGGFRVSVSQAGSDPRATTQAVPALAGAILSSLADPVTPVTPAAPTPPSSGGSTSTAPTSGATPTDSAAAGSGSGALATTGASTQTPLWWAAGLIVFGTALMLVSGRRRVFSVVTMKRRRH